SLPIYSVPAAQRRSVVVAFGARHDAIRLELRLERRVTDLQVLGGALAVPLVPLQSLAQEAPLEGEDRRLQALARLRFRSGRRREREVVRKVRLLDHLRVADHGHPGHDVLQLADVARPPIPLQELEGAIGERLWEAAVLGGVPGEEVLCQIADVLAPFTQ